MSNQFNQPSTLSEGAARLVGQVERDVSDAEFRDFFERNSITISAADVGSLSVNFGDTGSMGQVIHGRHNDIAALAAHIVGQTGFARQAAFQAVDSLPEVRQEQRANSILKNRMASPLVSSKEKLKAMKKSRMRTVKQFLCDLCDKVIASPTDGFIIQGNIYVADPDSRGGLIGNNFPEPKEDGSIKMEAVRETVLCKKCFFCATNTGMSEKPVPDKSAKQYFPGGVTSGPRPNPTRRFNPPPLNAPESIRVYSDIDPSPIVSFPEPEMPIRDQIPF